MPKVLQKVTGYGHTDWELFRKAIRAAMLTQIEEAKEEEKEARQVREELRRLQEMCIATTKDLMAAFQRLIVNPPLNTPPKFQIALTQVPNSRNLSQRHNNTPMNGQNLYQQNKPPAEQFADVT